MYCTVLCLALLPFVSSNIIDIFTGQQNVCALGQKCCPDGECYDMGYPWRTCKRLVPPPRCLEYPVKYLLSNRSNPTYPVVFTPNNFSKIQGYYSASKPTVIFTHGFLQQQNVSYMKNVTAVYLTKVDANAIFIDYSNISLNINYFQSVSDIRVAARYVTKAIKILIGFGTPPSKIHLIGFSLGAHFVAYVAKAIPGIGRLTGLDPAGPAFTVESCEVRFCKGDAVFTEAIHSNGHPLIGFGTSDEDADVDFWVNGGWDQPNCGITFNPGFFLSLLKNQNLEQDLPELPCSHTRAVFIYTEALANNFCLWGVKPKGLDLCISRLFLGYPTKFTVHTQGCTLDSCVPIGLQTINATGRGSFIVPTNYKSPFCVSQS